MAFITKTFLETENKQEIKYYLFGKVCYLSKEWLYSQRTIRLFGLLVSRKHCCFKQYIPNVINTNSFFGNFEKIKTNETIDIIIPVYNGYKYLNSLFKSLLNNTDLNYRLFVIDDASPDSRVYPLLQKWVKKFGDKAKLFQNKNNQGFVKTVNFGFTQTTNHVVLLNTDVVVPKNWLSRLMYPILKNKKVASVTPFSNGGSIYSFPEQNINNPLISDYQNIDDCLSTLKMSEKTFKKLVFPTGVGFCMAINRSVLNKVGGFSTQFGRGYGEENDWCMRVFNMGYFHTVAYNLFVWHNQGGSFGKEARDTLSKQNHKILLQNHPDYIINIMESSSNPLYQSILFFARMIMFNRYAKSTKIIFDTDTNNVYKSEKDSLLLILQYKKEIKSFALTQIYNDNIHTITDSDLDNLVDILKTMHFDEIDINNDFKYKKQIEGII